MGAGKRGSVHGGGSANSRTASRRKSTGRSSLGDQVEEDSTGVRFSEVCAAFAAGIATLLQQLPCSVTDSTLELSGLCINGFCSEGVEGKDASWAIGGKW